MRAVSSKKTIAATVLLSVFTLSITDAAQAYVPDEPETSSLSLEKSELVVANVNVPAVLGLPKLMNGAEPQTEKTPVLSQEWCQAERAAWIKRVPALKSKLVAKCNPEAYYWIKEAPRRYGLDPVLFMKTGACESGMYSHAVNGSYYGFFQHRAEKFPARVRSNNRSGRIHVNGDIWSAKDNMAVAAFMIHQDGSYRQWQCKGLSVSHSGAYGSTHAEKRSRR